MNFTDKFWGLHFNCPPIDSNSIGGALQVGTTITTRLWVTMFTFITALRMSVADGSVFPYRGYETLLDNIPLLWWVTGFYGAGFLMLWRMFTPKASPVWGWTSNLLTLTVWGTLVVSRLVIGGPASLASSITVVWIMAAWLTLRTEANQRDKDVT